MSNPNFAAPAPGHDLYDVKPPWDIDRPQPAFARLATDGAVRGRVLDIGCGTGEHALLAAGLGLDATGIDQSPRALEHAERKARERGLTARFLLYDALALAELGETFDTVLDCGLFHIFPPGIRSAYTESLASALTPGGRYFMLGFSDSQPGDWGPHRLSRTDIESSFADGWRIDSLDAAVIDIRTDPAGAAAWLATITRK
ncbi:class I SAM-dependent methyltransferase [Nocardia nova]|uniref:class I SAM-dependent methyltransferase n=1 Tax=Nocardia nova TaxID=37330 RepID=UPI0037B762B4